MTHGAGTVPAQFAPGDWSLAGTVTQNGDEYTFTGMNHAEEFGTFLLTCTPPPPEPMQPEVDNKIGELKRTATAGYIM